MPNVEKLSDVPNDTEKGMIPLFVPYAVIIHKFHDTGHTPVSHTYPNDGCLDL